MSKELDEFYKSYSARMTVIDDTPLVKVMDGGKFKLLSIEEYEEITNKLSDLEAKLAEKDEQIEKVRKEVAQEIYNRIVEIIEDGDSIKRRDLMYVLNQTQGESDE